MNQEKMLVAICHDRMALGSHSYTDYRSVRTGNNNNSNVTIVQYKRSTLFLLTDHVSKCDRMICILPFNNISRCFRLSRYIQPAISAGITRLVNRIN